MVKLSHVFFSRTSSTPNPASEESNISPHDLQVPIPAAPKSAAPYVSSNGVNQDHSSNSQRYLRVILFAPSLLPSDISPGSSNAAPMIERLTRFRALTGGVDLLIVFFLNEPNPALAQSSGSSSGLAAHSMLQTLLLINGLTLPVILAPSTTSLIALLTSYIQTLTQNSHSRPHSTLDAKAAARHVIMRILPLCTAAPPPNDRLTEHQVLRLTDIVGSIKELAQMASTEEGKRRIRMEMDEGDGDTSVGNGIVEFWEQEFVKEV